MNLFERVDAYLDATFVAPDEALEAALAASAAAGLPAIQVAPNQGKLLAVLARAIGARRILEIGTLAGYSTIWLARSGAQEIVTIEASAAHAEVARKNLAGLPVKIEVGRALDVLPTLSGPFDFVFVDADKASNAEYVSAALRLSRPGALIVVDNVVREGRVLDETSTDANVAGIRKMNELIAREPRLFATALQTVGSKGHDGLAILLVV